MNKKIIYALVVFSFGVFVPSAHAAINADLRFAASRYELSDNSTHELEIVADPKNNQIVGIDILLKYDPSKLEVTNIRKTEAFTDLLGQKIDNLAGTVRFSITNTRGRLMTQSASVAIVSVRPKQTGKTAINFDFSQNKTQDTNMVTNAAEDVLATVGGADLNIGALAPEPTRTQPRAPGRSNPAASIVENLKSLIETPPVGRTLGTSSEIIPTETDWVFWILLAIAGLLFTTAGSLIFVMMRQRDEPVQQNYAAN